MLGALFSRLWGYMVAAGAVLAGLAMWGASKKREGRTETYIEALRDKDKRMEAGRNAVSDLRGNSRDDDLEQLRRNDDQW